MGSFTFAQPHHFYHLNYMPVKDFNLLLRDELYKIFLALHVICL